MDLSVVIPTCNRREALERTLDALAAQDLAADRFEVVVANDGSLDDTAEFLDAYVATTSMTLRVETLEANGGPARARNRALARATGRLVLIMGDDIVGEPPFLARHLDWHERHPDVGAALLGYTTWPEALEPTAFMRWLEGGGRRYFFNYKDLPEGEPVSGMSFYTCNVSLKRELLDAAGPFDEGFPFASHEDLELGCRLDAQGMTLYFDRDAIAYHWHRLEIPSTIRRVYLMGHSSTLFWRKTGDDASALKRGARGLLRATGTACRRAGLLQAMATRGAQAVDQPLLWRLVLDLAYWCGAADGAAGRSATPPLAT